MSNATTTPEKKPGLFQNLAFNIFIPVVLLMYGSKPEYLGPTWGLVVALAFPVGYGCLDLFQSGKLNPFSVLGTLSILLTGGFSLLELDPQYIAIKEAAIPAIIGLVLVFTKNSKYSIIELVFLNRELIDVDKLNQVLEDQQQQPAFSRALSRASWLAASSFALSSVLNYVLATVILVSAPGTPEYNEELGKMTALSYPIIVVPSMIILVLAIIYLFTRIKKITGMPLEQFMVGE